MKLSNVTLIESETFSKRLVLPADSKLSIEIDRPSNPGGLTLEANAFNYIRIDRLHFTGIQLFNGRPVFDSTCFGDDLDIDELIFEQCGITGFSNSIRKAADVFSLVIVDSPALTQLTEKSLPSFLSTTKSLKISNTGLQLINKHTFDAWLLTLQELILTNNTNLTIFPSDIVDGVLMKLNKLDLSNNPIQTLERNYNWFAYSYVKHLSLRKQPWDLFLPTDILKTLPFLETIDLSDGLINPSNDELIKNHFPSMPNLTSIDLSRSNLTEKMLILLLERLSQSATHFIDIHLFGQRLNDREFCSYFSIFQKAPNLFNLHLDESHECNCVVDLLYTERIQQLTASNSLIRPACLSNPTRVPCNVQTQAITSKCSVSRPNPDGSGSDEKLGKYAFAGIVAGVSVLLVVLLSLGFGVVYRVRRRRSIELDMEYPIENPLGAIIKERVNGK